MDLLLNAENRFGASSSLYVEKRITLSCYSYLKKLKLLFSKPFLNMAFNKNRIDLSTIQIRKIEIGPYSDKWACEFYQLPGHLVIADLLYPKGYIEAFGSRKNVVRMMKIARFIV